MHGDPTAANHGSSSLPVPASRPSAQYRLAQLLESLIASQQPATPELRDAVSAYVSELKAHDVAPERVVVLMKEAMQHAAAHGSGSAPLSEPEGQTLFTQVITWSIAAYFPRAD